MKTVLHVVTISLLSVTAAFADDAGPRHMTRATKTILITSEAGDKLAVAPNVLFHEGIAGGTVIVVRPHRIRQTIEGIGTLYRVRPSWTL